MGRARLLLFGVGFCLAAGCVRDPDPIDIDTEAVTVHAVLEAGADSVAVLVTRPASGTLSSLEYRPVTGALVRLIHDADSTWLIEGAGATCVAGDEEGLSAGCYQAPLDSPIRPGGEYLLEIELTGGDRITGATRVPAAPTIVSPAQGSRIPAACGDPVRCDGQVVQAAPHLLPVARFPIGVAPAPVAGFQVHVLSRQVMVDGTAHAGAACSLGSRYAGTSYPYQVLVGDSADWGVEHIVCGGQLEPARFDSIRVDVIVTALDSSYADYLRAVLDGSTVRDATVRQGLEGAYGVFGAAASFARRIVLIRDPPPTQPDGTKQP